jgi:hypothetical protein
MSSDKIPGVPEGWELVRIGKPEIGEWFIDGLSEPYQAIDDGHFRGCAIIRKIEKPAKYRQFKDTEEYMFHWGKPIRLKDGVGFDSVVSTSRIGIYVANETLITRYSMADAFKRLEFADGTPFGVRVDE